MTKKREKSLFWASYADLMTSLFFLMLILFAATTIVLNEERKRAEEERIKWEHMYRTSEQEKKQLQAINDAIRGIDEHYFEYSEDFKKHKLKITVNFPENEHEIRRWLSSNTQNELLQAGKILKQFINEKTEENPNIQFLLIIEGQASRTGTEAINYPLSYNRAYNLKKFWEENGITFPAKNCEVIICGSGDGRQSGTGLMREQIDRLNQRFLIHILPKPGYTNESSVQ